jgi:hypothetical protein
MNRLTFYWLLCVLCSSAASGCIFDTSGLPGDDIDGSGLDAPVDGAVSMCTPDQSYCDGRVLQMCRGDGTGPVAGTEQLCDFACVTDACVQASDVPAIVYASCDGTAPALTPLAGTTLRFEKPGAAAQITCVPDCGDGSTTSIGAVRQEATPARAWFCLSSMNIPAGVTVTTATNLAEAIILLVDGAAEIAGTVDFRGRRAMSTSAGSGGPGGGAGGARASGSGNDGQGACPGRGGSKEGAGTGSEAGGGGGGGGYGGTGGAGGTGRNSLDGVSAAGGAGGDLCGNQAIVPLVGGGGGGSGGDASCGGACGWPGGGGGGAIQIAARASILVSGSINTSGGDGHGVTSGIDSVGGAGGGGSGGAILLESPAITISGYLIANGGRGGTGAAGSGGAGATGVTGEGGEGASYLSPGQGGSGGGGGGGRIRINTPGAATPCDASVSPGAICTAGGLFPSF